MRIEKIKSPFDNLMLEVAVSETKTQPKAIVQFSHGMCEHKERYFEFMNYLNDNGFVALEIGYDQAPAVTQIMDGYGYNYIEVLKDMSGIARFPFGYR